MHSTIDSMYYMQSYFYYADISYQKLEADFFIQIWNIFLNIVDEIVFLWFPVSHKIYTERNEKKEEGRRQPRFPSLQ